MLFPVSYFPLPMNNVIYSEEVFFLFDFGFFGRKGKRKGGRGGGKGRKGEEEEMGQKPILR
jgi:hypothetical protein